MEIVTAAVIAFTFVYAFSTKFVERLASYRPARQVSPSCAASSRKAPFNHRVCCRVADS